MSVYKEEKSGTWYVMVRYDNWKGERKQKCKRGFSTKKEAQEWERRFTMQTSSNMNMLFGDFVKLYVEDMLLAGPYMEISSHKHNSFSNFMLDKNFSVLDYNNYEIVNKEYIDIKGKANYCIAGQQVLCGKLGIFEKVYNIVRAITTSNENTIIYNNRKAGTERYAKELIALANKDNFSFAVSYLP